MPPKPVKFTPKPATVRGPVIVRTDGDRLPCSRNVHFVAAKGH